MYDCVIRHSEYALELRHLPFLSDVSIFVIFADTPLYGHIVKRFTRRSLQYCDPGPSAVREPLWFLDLDNTLHDAFTHTFPDIKEAMGQFIARELDLSLAQAGQLRDHYGRRYGATLLGLARHHAVRGEQFLHEVHPLGSLEQRIRPRTSLTTALRQLPGRRVLLTNAPRAYACEVVRLLGLREVLDEIISIEAMVWAGQIQPKPSRQMFRRLVAAQRVLPSRCILVEDSVANLRQAQAIGLKGVLVTGFVAGLGEAGSVQLRAGRAISARRIVHRVRTVQQLPGLLGQLGIKSNRAAGHA